MSDPVRHYAYRNTPFIAACGEDKPDQTTTNVRANVTCPACIPRAPCGCSTCAPTAPSKPPRKLLTKSRLAELRVVDRSRERCDIAGQLREIADAYEVAVRLLEEVVRDRNADPSVEPGRVTPGDIAWLALREAEK
jgi:hypothetical protein